MINLYALIEARPLHPNLGKPLYVGIGTAHRPRAHFRDARSPEGCRNRLLSLVLREHFALGIEPGIDVISTHATRAEADAAERAAIVAWGRAGRDPDGVLCNVARGGDGPDSTLMQDPEIVAKIAAASARYWSDPLARERQAEAIRTHMADPAYRAASSAAVRNALHKPEIRERHLAGLARVNAAFTKEQRVAAAAKKSEDGKARSIAALLAAHADPEIQAKRRENSREPQKNSWADPEIRARRVAAMKGKKKTASPEALAARRANAAKPRSEEARAAQRAGSIRRWEAVRAAKALEDGNGDH